MIKIIGIGPAGTQWLTAEGKEAIQWAHLVVGSQRQIESVENLIDYSQSSHNYNGLKDLVSSLDKYIEFQRSRIENCEQGISKWTPDIAVLASGDPSLYGIAKYLIGIYGQDQVKVIPGISSIQYLFSKIGVDMNDVYLTSCHGRDVNYDWVFQMKKTGLLTDEGRGPFDIASEARKRGLNPKIVVGENLGYPEEQIRLYDASALPDQYYAMNVVIVINDENVDTSHLSQAAL